MAWPQFEEYTEEFREIAPRSKKNLGGTVADGNITMINQRSVCDDLPEYNVKPVKPAVNGVNKAPGSTSGNPGICNDHACTVEGTTRITSIEVQTYSCLACYSKNTKSRRGAIITVLHYQASHTTTGHCTTRVLDHEGKVDYAGTRPTVFDDNESLGSCYMFESEDWPILEVKVGWQGQGAEWIPQYIKINFDSVASRCCYNDARASVDDITILTLSCTVCKPIHT